MKPVRIAVSNLGGGEGRTTVTRELGFALTAKGYRVALFDLDPQASLSHSLGLFDKNWPILNPIFESNKPTFDLLPPSKIVEKVDIWPATASLGDVRANLFAFPERIGNLRQVVDQLLDKVHYDYVLIDCVSENSALLTAALAAANEVIVPIASLKGLDNIDELLYAISCARQYAKDLSLLMLVPNQIQLAHHHQLLKSIRTAANAPVSHPIRKEIKAVGEANAARLPVMVHFPDSGVAQDFNWLADEILINLQRRNISIY